MQSITEHTRALAARRLSLRGSTWLLTAALGITGCVSQDAGYGDLRTLLSTRGSPIPASQRGELRALDAESRVLLNRPLTAEAAVRLALLNHPDAAAAMASVGVARAQLVGSAALPNPHAEVAVQFGHESPTVELGVMQNLTELILYSAKRGAGDAALQATVAETAQQLLLIGYRAQTEFYKLQSLEKKLRMQRAVLQMAYASYEMAQRLRVAGNITELALARQQATYESVRLGVAQLESETLQQRLMFASALGIADAPPTLTAVPMPEIDLTIKLPVSQAELNTLRDNSLELLALRSRFTSEAEQLSYTRGRGWLPELKAGVTAEREEGEWAVGPGVELELPLFYQGQGETGAAKAKLLQLRAKFGAAAMRVHTVSAAAQERRAHAQAQVEYFRATLLPLHERLVAAAQLQYNAMSIGAFELLSAKHEHLRIQQQSVDAELNYWLAEADWKLLLAGALPQAQFSVPMGMPASAPAAAEAAH